MTAIATARCVPGQKCTCPPEYARCMYVTSLGEAAAKTARVEEVQNADGTVTRWALSKNGRVKIAFRNFGDGTFSVHGIYVGTHDLAPMTLNRKSYTEARTWANRYWALY